MTRWVRVGLFFLVFMITQTFAVIYRLNGTEFERMPPISLLDDYDACMYDLEPLYCTTELELVSDTPSDLLNLIRNYSERKLTHYNYSSLYRGVCVTRSCNISKEATLRDRHNALEECLNNTLWQQYRLKARLTTHPMCYPTDKNIELDEWDIFVAMICVFIVTLNIAATFYDLQFPKKPRNKGVDLFLAFSIFRNWSRLNNDGNRTKPTVERLKGIDGLSATFMIFIITGHGIFSFMISASNTRFIEELYYLLPSHLVLNGMYMVQYFFVMSGCLLSYHMERSTEKKQIKWTQIPSYIFKRWLRLTPSLAVVLAITSTWLRFMGTGPLWQAHETKELIDCRRYWLWNLMYMTNYKDGSHCMPHGWYLAADMHLYCLGVVILTLVKKGFWRKVVLASMLLIGILTPAIPTYIFNLDMLLALSPQSFRNYAANEPTFDFLYKRSYTNLATYTIGIITGICLHHWQKNKCDVNKFKKFVLLYWASIPMGIGIIVFNKVFFNDGPQVPLFLRILFQMFARPVLSVLFVALVIGMVFKLENTYRGFFEWNGWAWIARVSYSAYVSHATIYRLLCGNSTSLIKISLFSVVSLIGMGVLAFMVATAFWLILEAPVNQIVKICFESPAKMTHHENNVDDKQD